MLLDDFRVSRILWSLSLIQFSARVVPLLVLSCDSCLSGFADVLLIFETWLEQYESEKCSRYEQVLNLQGS
ncbi:uncharacterized protein BDZ99DRAFT_460213 [Mytilinidion resinicola]|uniref:Uncharacterized protein n=1 Tax=Mytilinidion resinicola TaxID=574789 RepID=A0A6A6YWS5_9PEZI|nr:uncharacterized protein BDZ99DRAFT_460213 [Mytilinidion resinicola]KAF2812853.1 hypothetical protein BDZ99DRAFT_460213 [Mytilinidion resinicola]